MIDPNNFNFQDFTQGQNIDFGENQVFQGNMEQNQEGNTVDLANFTQDNGVLQATAGLEGLNNNVEFLGQNNELQTNTLDSDALMGETLKTGTVVPDFFGQNFQGTTTTNTTNVVEGNIDPNAFFGNTNVDTNQFFGQTENIQTTTTNINNFGEGLMIQGNDANAFIGEAQNQNKIDFGAIQTEQTGGQNIFGTYQASGTNDVNSIGYGTMEMQAGAQLQPIPFSIPETQTTTQTTTQTITTQPALTQFQTQNIGEQLDFEAYPATNTTAHHTNEKNEVIQVQNTNEIPLAETQYIPNFDITHFQQTLDATPLATSHQVTTTTQTQITPPPQVVPPPVRKVVATPQPIVQATYTPPPQPIIQTAPSQTVVTIPKPVIQTPPPQPIFQAATAPKPVVQTTYNIPQVQTTTITTPPPVQVVPQQQIIQQYQYQTVTNPIVLQSQTQLLQTGIKPVGNQMSNGLVDEDFRRGRPVYNEVGVPSTKLKIQNNQLNTYTARNIIGHNNNKIGMSKLAHAPSYNIKLVPPSLNLYNQGIKTDLNTNLTNNLNNQVNTINTNVANNLAGNINTVGNTINNVTNNINTGLDKVGKASSYNVGQQVITPLLNNVGLGQNNIAPDNTRLVQLKDFL